eukprot:49118-Eustigmatos_ZCMA.PRE.1
MLCARVQELVMVISGLVNVEYDGVNVMEDMALLCLRKNDDTLGIKVLALGLVRVTRESMEV